MVGSLSINADDDEEDPDRRVEDEASELNIEGT